MHNQSELVAESGTVSLTDDRWSEARRRAAIIGPLADLSSVSQQAAEEAGHNLGLTARTVYTLLRAWRRSGGSVPMLTPVKPDGGRGKIRLETASEAIIGDAVERFYLTAQKPRLSAVVKEIRRRCRIAGLKAPASNTVKARINQLRPDKVLAKREGSKAAQRLKPAPGATPEARGPLDVIQMDHTKIDVIVVDPVSRLPIGRPFLTVAIDEFSRCIVGICVTLDAPSATSVGLCLTHTAMEKGPWLERMNADCAWPMRGKPKRIYVDNGVDFHSEGLRRGCEVRHHAGVPSDCPPALRRHCRACDRHHYAHDPRIARHDVFEHQGSRQLQRRSQSGADAAGVGEMDHAGDLRPLPQRGAPLVVAAASGEVGKRRGRTW